MAKTKFGKKEYLKFLEEKLSGTQTNSVLSPLTQQVRQIGSKYKRPR